jgi:hypothetical protein
MVAEELGPVIGAGLNAEDDENLMGWRETRLASVDAYHSERRRQGRRSQSGIYRHV